MMNQESLDINQLINLRHELHQHPEISNQEKQTAKRITTFLKSTSPDEIINDIGKYGVAAIYKGENSGASVMIRCELDGLPIQEINQMEYQSIHEGISHKCGHDGHMSIVCGVADLLAKHRPATGRVILLFQPAEETGEGANLVLQDEKFKAIKPDFVYALHNLPGFEKHQIVIKDDIFASASRGMIIKLKGTPSHASHPQDGRNPSLATSQIIQHLFEIPQMHTQLHRPALITPVYMRVGSPAFGTSAGDAEIMATLRTHHEDDMQIIADKAVKVVNKLAELHELEVESSWTDTFEAVQNNKECTQVIHYVADQHNLKIYNVEQPFPWSEDFGLFTSHYRGALFGLGSGKNQPQLHNNDYDFPDDIIETGITMFWNIIDHHLGQSVK